MEILKIVLSLDPTHLNARTLRMVLLRNLAIDAPSFAIAEGMFAQAHLEADIIQQNCAYQSEDFHCEYAVVYLAQAMATLRHLRSGGAGSLKSALAQGLKQRVFDSFARANTLFAAGMVVSPTGIRANYLLNTVKVLQGVLQNDATLFRDDRRIDGKPEVVRKPVAELQWQLGFDRKDLPEEHPYARIENIFQLLHVSHDDSIALQAYRPTTYFCTAVAWWDLFPVRTVAGAKRAVQLLKSAADIARVMEQNDICIYSFTRTYGEMIPASEFIRHIDCCLEMIREQSGGDLHTRDDHEIIEPKDPEKFSLLMTLNF